MWFPIDAIKRYGVYLVAALCLLYNVGLLLQIPWLVTDNSTIMGIESVLGFLGLGSFRVKIAEAFAGIDLGPVGLWITGKKTYITAVAGILYTVVTVFFHIPFDNPWVLFGASILGIFGITTNAMAVKTYTKQVQAQYPVAEQAFKKAA